MKIIRHILVASLVIVPLTAISSGIPVVDALGNAERIYEWSKKVEQWGQTTTHYQNQIKAYEAQLKSATGVRNIGDFTNELTNLQSELRAIYDKGDSYIGDFTTNPSGALSPEATAVFEKYKAFDMCNTGVVASDNLCKAKVVTTAANIEQGNTISKELTESMQQIDKLSSRIEKSEDIKDSQDLANALQAQSLRIQAIKIQYDVWANKNKADSDMFDKQEEAAYDQRQIKAAIPTFN